MSFHYKIFVVTFICLLLFKGCDKAPKYKTPTVSTPPAYKELTPTNFKETDGWKFAHPNDAALRGNWWEIFNNTELNSLETQVNISNQNIAMAEANFRIARALVKEARSEYFPTVTVSPSITVSRNSTKLSQSNFSTGRVLADYSLPFEATCPTPSL